ncbi:MAG: RibD family protein [bacterium]
MRRQQTPNVTVSYAQSIDGRIATSTGESRWISCEESLNFAHSLRGQHAAIMVGIGTVLADDPLLTCRLPECRSPHRIVLDSTIRLPLDSNITRTAFRVPTTVICSHESLARKQERVEELRSNGINVVSVTRASAGLRLDEVFDYLALQSLDPVFVEGGGELITALLREHRVSRLIVVIAPLLIGKGHEAIGDLQVEKLAEARRAESVSVRQYGCDLAWELTLSTAPRDEYAAEDTAGDTKESGRYSARKAADPAALAEPQRSPRGDIA